MKKNSNWEVVSRKQINDKAWNDCVGASVTPMIYALTHYLDAIHPGWKGLVQEGEKGYDAVMPLTIRKCLTIPFLLQPLFAQQLGVFSKKEKKIDTFHLLKEMFPYINYQGNAYEDIISLSPAISWRTNIVKQLSSSADVMTGYNQNRKRDIKKALKAGLTISETHDSGLIINFFKATKGKEINAFKPKHYNRLQKLVETLQAYDQVHLSCVYDAKGLLVSGGIFTHFKNRITFLFGTSGAEGRKCGAMTFLLHEMIKKYTKSCHTFDFEGSDIEGLKKYYLSFGGGLEHYPLYYSNQLPWPLNMIIR